MDKKFTMDNYYKQLNKTMREAINDSIGKAMLDLYKRISEENAINDYSYTNTHKWKQIIKEKATNGNNTSNKSIK